MKTEERLERLKKVITQNRKARHDYEITRSIEAGIVLLGTEVKSLRDGKCSIQDAYASFPKDDYELMLINFHINPYEHGNIQNHEPMRPRKLLVKHKEAVKLKVGIQEKGYTLIPLAVYFSGHLVKIELGLGKGKRQYDKRESVKERDTEREIRKKYKV